MAEAFTIEQVQEKVILVGVSFHEDLLPGLTW